jgi:hypothetical protein
MELLLTIVVAATCYALVKRSMEQKDKARADNVRLLEEALRNPQLDRQTVEALAERLTDRRAGLGAMSALFLFVGWIGLFVAAGLLIASANVTGSLLAEDLRLGGWITGLCAFGCLSYPFALRELEARRRA